jgi:hypothetical protein
MADRGDLILVIYKNPKPDKSGHIAFIANSGLTLSTSPKTIFEDEKGTTIDRNRFWPIVAQAGVKTGITSIVYATNGYNDGRPKLLSDFLHFYRFKGAAQ